MQIPVIYKGRNIIGSITISYFIFILLVILFNRLSATRITSYAIVVFSAFPALLYLGWNSKYKYGFNITGYILLGLLVKLLIGFIFWQFYLFPDYFSDPASNFKFDHREYLMTEQWMRQLAEYRLKFGYFSAPNDMLLTKHFSIHFFMSNFYLSGKYNTLDISVQNSVFSIFTAIIIAHIVKLEGGNSKQIKLALLLAIFQPMSLISTMIWRDVVGQFFIAYGGYLIYKASKSGGLNMVILITIASLSMYMQRLIYLFYPLLTILGFYLFQKRGKYKLFFIPFVIFIVVYFNNTFLVSEQLAETYVKNINSTTLWIFLPFNIVRLLLGPLPWTNWFNFNDNTIFLISDYFQSVMDISLIILVFLAYRKIRKQMNLNSFFILFVTLFFLFVLAGLGTGDIHLPYMATGAIFLIPIVTLIQSNQKFYSIFLMVFIFYIFLNIFGIALGLTGQGLGGSLR